MVRSRENARGQQEVLDAQHKLYLEEGWAVTSEVKGIVSKRKDREASALWERRGHLQGEVPLTWHQDNSR